ncbi:MAG: hypothetical protein FIB04_01745 [Gammaproteobacteria bacterium]|nr:hypothetical protein [Gammaproteobacteria bacterium]
MTKWHTLSLGDAATAQVPLMHLQEEFEEEFAAGDRAPDAAVFVRYESEGRLHCEAVVFIAPGAAVLAERFGARPCARPARAGLDLVAGDERCWDVIWEAG